MKTRLSESEAEVEEAIARPGIEHCHWFTLLLLLGTPTMQFSLDRKRRSYKQTPSVWFSLDRIALPFWLRLRLRLCRWSLGKQWIMFPENLNVSRDEVERNVEILGTQNSLFPKGPVIMPSSGLDVIKLRCSFCSYEFIKVARIDLFHKWLSANYSWVARDVIIF